MFKKSNQKLVKKMVASMMLPIFVFQMSSLNMVFANTARATEGDVPAMQTEPSENVSGDIETNPEILPASDESEEVIEEESRKEEEKEIVVEPKADTLVTDEEKLTEEENKTEEVKTESKKEATWEIDGKKATMSKVELDKTYVAPQNDKVTVTFSKLPENPGSLTIEEVTLTDEQIAELGALSDKAYDITSDMKNGTFEYDLTLPKPENESDVQVKFAEDVDNLDKAEVATDIDVKNNSVEANEMNHFTIFVVTNDPEDCEGEIYISGTCYDNLQDAIDSANNGDTIDILDDIEVESRVIVNKEITIDGKNNTISPSFSKIDNSNNSSLVIFSNNTTVKNIVIDGEDGTGLHGINIYKASNVLLDNVTVSNNDSSGITVNGSIVTVENIVTSGNGWGGINVDQGSGVTMEAKLIVKGHSSHNETTHIWLDDIRKNVLVDDTLNQYYFTDYENTRVYMLKEIIDSLMICHMGGNGKYNLETISNSGALNGHIKHNGDIIPPIEDLLPLGKNWEEGEIIWNNDCEIGQYTGTVESSFTSSEFSVRENNYGDVASQVKIPAVASEVQFSIMGIGSQFSQDVIDSDYVKNGYDNDIYKISGAASGFQWYRVGKNLPGGKYIITGKFKINDNWYDIAGSANIYSIDTPWFEYVTPSREDQTFRPTDMFARVKIDDQYNQTNSMSFKIFNSENNLQIGGEYIISRKNCDLRSEGQYIICDLMRDYDGTKPSLNGSAYYLKVQSNGLSGSGIRYQNTKSLNFNIDETRPTLNDFKIENIKSIYRSDITVSLLSSDNNKVANVEFYITKPRLSDNVCDGNGTKIDSIIKTDTDGDDRYRATFNTSSLNGSFCVNAIAEDIANSHSEIKKLSAVFDNVAPELPEGLVIYKGHNSNTNNKIPANGYTNNTQIRIAWDANLESDDVDYYWLGTKTNPYHKKVYGTYYDGNMTPGNNPYYYTVLAVDGAGNEGPIAISYTIFLDLEKPAIPTLISPENNSFMKGKPSLVNSWSVVPDAVKYIYESYHNEEATNLRWHEEFKTNSKSASNVPDTTFWWRVKAVDAAGNESGWSELWKVTVDNTAPTATVNYSVASLTNGNVIATLNPSEPVTVTNNLGNTYTFTENGEFTFEFKDEAGNTGSVLAKVDNIDKTIPVAQIITPISSLISGTVAIRGLVSDNHPHHYWLAIFKKSNGQQVYSKVVNHTDQFSDKLFYSWNTKNVEDGEYQIKFAERDAADNRSADFVVDIEVDNTSPNLYFKTPFSGWYNSTQTSVFEFTDDNLEEEYGDLNCTIDTEGEDQTCSVTPTICDKAGNCYTLITESNGANIDKTDPASTINGGGDNEIVYSNSWDGKLSGTASDNLSGVEIVKLSIQNGSNKYWNGSAWQTEEFLVEASGINSWDYTLGSVVEGSYIIKSHAIDNAGNMENTYTLTIVLDKTIPEINLAINPNSANGQNGWYDTIPEINLTANDNINLDKIEYQIDSQAGIWVTYTEAVKINDGKHIFYYRSLDKAGNYSAVEVKNVKVDTQAPDEISSLDVKYDGEKNTVKLDWSADDSDIDQVYIYRGTSKNFDTNSGSRMAKNNDNDKDITDRDVARGEKYYYKLVSVDEAGNKSDEKNISVEIPESGEGVIVTDEGTNETASQAPQENNSAGENQNINTDQEEVGEKRVEGATTVQEELPKIQKRVWPYFTAGGVGALLLSWFLRRRKMGIMKLKGF